MGVPYPVLVLLGVLLVLGATLAIARLAELRRDRWNDAQAQERIRERYAVLEPVTGRRYVP